MLRGQNNLYTGGAQTSDFTNKLRDYNYKQVTWLQLQTSYVITITNKLRDYNYKQVTWLQSQTSYVITITNKLRDYNYKLRYLSRKILLGQ